MKLFGFKEVFSCTKNMTANISRTIGKNFSIMELRNNKLFRLETGLEPTNFFEVCRN